MNQLDLGFLDKFPLWTIVDSASSSIEMRTTNGLKAFPLVTNETLAKHIAASSVILNETPIESQQELLAILKEQKEVKGISYVFIDPNGQLNTVAFILDLIDAIEKRLDIE